jgi:signal recognition particle receptor subunit beta
LSEGLVGYIFLIDAQNDQDLEYTNYLISNLITTHDVPYTLAVTNLDKSVKKVPAKIKSGILLDKRKTIHICDVSSKDDVRKVIMSLQA